MGPNPAQCNNFFCEQNVDFKLFDKPLARKIVLNFTLILKNFILGSKSGGGMHRSMSKSSAGWSGSNKGRGNTSSGVEGATDDMMDPNNPNSAMPRLSVCADSQKVDRAKLAQTEVNTVILSLKAFSNSSLLFNLYCNHYIALCLTTQFF